MRSALPWTAVAMLCATLTAHAQRADDNALHDADDAFGSNNGMEQVGIYGEDEVRGFNPQSAGNIRIEGLYFDQQGVTSHRSIDGSTVRVGANVLRYAFPAPTGIIDLALRRPRDDVRVNGALELGPFETRTLELSTTVHAPASAWQIPVALRAGTKAELPGLTLQTASIGLVPEWKPRAGLTLRLLVDLLRENQQRQQPLIYLQSDATSAPALTEPRYSGQDWAESDYRFNTLGAMLDTELTPALQLSAGLFRSRNTSVTQYLEQIVEVGANGVGNHELAGYPEQMQGSTSGELRLAWQRAGTSHRERVIATLRGREVEAHYGGEDFRSAGSTPIEQVQRVPRPAFAYGPLTSDRSSLYALGLAIESTWRDRASVSVGLQRMRYRKRVLEPGSAPVLGADDPWRGYGNGTWRLSPRLLAYAGFTQGLEDSGLAPPTANNRGSVLPAVRTSQRDAGLRLTLRPGLKLVAGVFDVQKPYFNLAANGDFRILGEQRHRGLELSLNGTLAPRLQVFAGASVSRPSVTSNGSSAAPLGSLAVGQRSHLLSLTMEYELASHQGLSVDATLTHYGERAGSLDNRIMLPAAAEFDLGARYKLPLRKSAATLRVQLINITDQRSWHVDESGGYMAFAGRFLTAYLVMER